MRIDKFHVIIPKRKFLCTWQKEVPLLILCIGEAVIDMFQKNVPGLGDVFTPIPGGCCYNTSIAIGKLGVSATFLGRLSKNFFGDIQIQRLRENNVKDDLIIRCDENPILAIVKTEKGKQPQYAFYDEGTSDRLLSIGELPVIPAETSCIVFGSISMNMEPMATTIETLLTEGHNNFCPSVNKTVIAFDPNIRIFMIKDRASYMQRFNKWAGFCTIAKISSEDFEYIFPDTEPEKALQKMLNLGTRLAIATLGPDGAIALLKRDDKSVIKTHVKGIRVSEIADTVGAGDTFLGAFLSWLDKKEKLSHNAIINLSESELYDALLFANKAAAIVCTRNGAQPPTLHEVESIK